MLTLPPGPMAARVLGCKLAEGGLIPGNIAFVGRGTARLPGCGVGVGSSSLSASGHGAPGWRRVRGGQLVALATGNEGSMQAHECPDKKRILLRYVKDVEPALMEAFLEGGPPHVVDAMRATVTNLLGTLPPAFFTVTISTVAENMGQLMLSVLMTGYCFRAAQYRLQLRTALGGGSSGGGSPSARHGAAAAAAAGTVAALPDGLLRHAAARSSSPPPSASGEDSPPASALGTLAADVFSDDAAGASGAAAAGYAPGVQKSRVRGEVLMWHNQHGLESLDAVAYMELLEAEVVRLRSALGGVTTDNASSDSDSGDRPPSSSSSSRAGGAAAAIPPAAPRGGGAAAGGRIPAQQQPGSSSQRQLSPPPPRGNSSNSSGASASSSFSGDDERQLPVPAAPRSLTPASASGSSSALLFDDGAPPNELLDYLRGLDAAALTDLTGSAGPEVSAAMDGFVSRLMGTGDRDALSRAGSECSSTELGRLLLWCMVVGYTLRGLEARWEMERASGGNSSGSTSASSSGSGSWLSWGARRNDDDGRDTW